VLELGEKGRWRKMRIMEGEKMKEITCMFPEMAEEMRHLVVTSAVRMLSDMSVKEVIT
jgi:hypothetical protein